MDSLIALISRPDRLQSKSKNGKLDQFFDLKKLNNAALLRIDDTASRLPSLDNTTLHQLCDCSKLTQDELSSIWRIDTDHKTFTVLKNLLSDTLSNDTLPLSLEEFRSIQFNQFSNDLLQNCLGMMLTLNIDKDFICVLLDQMASVNYGVTDVIEYCDRFYKINPLIHCCATGKIELVKLLIDRYGANIEYQSPNGTTAIMYSAGNGHVEITKYLFKKGARLETKTQDIDMYPHYKTRPLIEKWKKEILVEKDQKKTELEKMKTDFDMMKLDNERLKSENDLIKRNCENILNLIQNPKK